jgi:hypothetical protein
LSPSRNRRRNRPPLAAPESVEGILDRAGESRFASVRPAVAPRVWRAAVGARIAERAAPVSLYGGVLLLRVPSSVWAHELSLLSSDLCARLCEHGVEVRELRFRVGALPAVDRPPERRSVRSVPAAQPVPREVEEPLSRIDDEALRSAIARAVGANLAWQTATRPAPAQEISEARRAARAPRPAERESAPPGPGYPASRGAPPGTRGGGQGRPR